MTIFNMTDFDIFYLSFDEPRKEEFWARLLDVAPWAKRVDGVKGFDGAHKECAKQSDTFKFITVDGDNLINPDFLNLTIEVDEKRNTSYSWASVNNINGLIYGNGGLKLWDKEFVLKMKSHENAVTEAEKVDFCWLEDYQQMPGIYSTTYPNGSPFQAFRAGMREGVKMMLKDGNRVRPNLILEQCYKLNLQRLAVWASIGADIENGYWSMYGTRVGIAKVLDDSWDLSHISDFSWFKKYWENDVPEENKTHEESLIADIFILGKKITNATGLPLSVLGKQESKFVKFITQAKEMEI